MFLRNTFGEYEPSFFIIRIDADVPISTVVDQHQSTFVHEYIHFLQDLTLPYCIRENLARLHEFFMQIAQACSQKEIHLPTHLIDADYELTKRQTELTWGNNGTQENADAIMAINSEFETFEGLTGPFNVYKYVISTTNGSDYHLGARDLLEYLAYKIEARHFPGEEKLPDLPYRSVDLVFEYFGLSCLSDQKRVAVAEYCLLNDNPVRRLMVVIEDLLGGQFDEGDLADDERFIECLLNQNWQARGVPFETVTVKIKRRLGELKDFLLSKFPEQSFPAIYAWLDGVIDYASRDLAGQLLFARLYGLDTPNFQDAISEILRNVGIPLLVNRDEEIGTSLGDNDNKYQFLQLLLAYEFSYYVKRDDPICPMYGVCEQSNPTVINDDCMEAPFRRAHDEKLCPFGVFIKAHGLADITWYVKDQVLPGVAPVRFV